MLAAVQDAQMVDADWHAAWERTKNEVNGLLGRSDGSTSGGVRLSDVPSSERITLTELDSFDAEDDRTTPIMPPAPGLDDCERVA